MSLFVTRSFLVLATIFFLCTEGLTAPRFARTSGNWNSTAVWSATVGGATGASVPGAGDAVTINPSITVTVNVASNAQSVVVNGILNITGTFDLTIANGGAFTVNSGGIVSFASGGQVLGGGNNAAGIDVTINSGARLNTANVLGFTTGTGNTTLTGSIAIRPGSFGAPTFNADVDYQYNGTAAQVTGNAVTAADNIFITNTAGAVTSSVNLTVSTVLNLSASTTFAVAATTLTLPGTGTPVTTTGTLTSATNGTVVYSGASAQNIKSATYYNLTFSGNGGKTIPTAGVVTVSNNWVTGTAAVNLTGTANITVAASITGSADITMGSGTLTANGSDANAFGNTGNFTRGTGTVVYGRSGTQTVKNAVYNNLTLAGSSDKTITSSTVEGILSMEGTATVTAAPTYGTDATLRYNRTANQVADVEWPASFTAGTLTGGVVISNTGDITLDAAKTLGTGMPLTLNSGAVLVLAQSLNLSDDLVNSGGSTSGAGDVTIEGGQAQSIGAFVTSGVITVSKTANAATLAGNVTGGGQLVINNSGTGALNLGTGLTHTFSTLTFTNGELVGGTSTMNITGASLYTAGTFTPGTGTIGYTGASPQTMLPGSYYNLTFSGAGGKTIPDGTSVIVANNWVTGTAAIDMAGTASVTVGANITGSAPITMGSGVLTANGATTNAFANSGTFTRGSGTVVYGRSGAQTVRQVTYNNLVLSGNNTKTITTAGVLVEGILSMEGAATASAVPTYGISSTLRYNRTADQNTGAEWPAAFTAGRLTGGVVIDNTGEITLATPANKVLASGMPLTINSGASLVIAQNITLNADLINNGGITSGAGNVTITGADAQLIGSFTTTGTVTTSKSAGGVATFTGNVSGGPFVVNNNATGILNLGTALVHSFTNFTRTLGVLQGNTSVLNISGTVTNTAGTFTADNGRVNFTGGGGQTIPPLTYYDLGFSGNGTKTIATGSTITVDNNWIVASTTTMTTTASVAVGGSISSTGNITMGSGTITVTGDWSNSGTFAGGTGAVQFNGSAPQNIPGLPYYNLRFSQTGVKTFTENTTVNNILTIGAASEVNGGTITLTLAASGTPLVNNGGVFTPASSTVAYTSTGSTNITALDYYNLTGSAATGARTLPGSATIGILGDFIPGGGSYTVPVTNIIDFKGTSDQLIPAFSYGKLVVSTAGIKRILASVIVFCRNIDIEDDASVEINADGGGKLNVLD